MEVKLIWQGLVCDGLAQLPEAALENLDFRWMGRHARGLDSMRIP